MPIRYKRSQKWPLWEREEIFNEGADVVGFEAPVCFRLNRMIGAGFIVDAASGQLATNVIELEHQTDGTKVGIDDSGLVYETNGERRRFRPDDAEGFEAFCAERPIPEYRKQLGERLVTGSELLWYSGTLAVAVLAALLLG